MNEIGYTTENWFKSNLKKRLAESDFVGHNAKTFSTSASAGSDLFQSGFRERIYLWRMILFNTVFFQGSELIQTVLFIG